MRRVLGLFMLTLLVPVLIFAGTTGKIAGRVVAAETGEPLPGANVIIEGTTMGAAADENGYYYIINVPPGTYTLRASMIGRESQVKTDVLVVQDLTTTVNFELSETAVVGKEVKVKAKRPMVIKDATQTTRLASGKDIEKMPVTSFQAVVATQAGVVGSHIRGGRGDEVAYMVDGMSVKDPIFGGLAASINNNAIQEVNIITGGFNAEYGQAMSGVVNVVTKEGGKKLAGQLAYSTDAFMPKFMNFGYHRMEASIGGPLPGPVRFFLSADAVVAEDRSPHFHEVSDYPMPSVYSYDRLLIPGVYDYGAGNLYSVSYLVGYTSPEETYPYNGIVWKRDYVYRLPHQDAEAFHFQGKLTLKPIKTTKINIGGFFARDMYAAYSSYLKYNLENYIARARDAWQAYLVWNQMIGNAAFFSWKFNMFQSYVLASKRDEDHESERMPFELYEFVPTDSMEAGLRTMSTRNPWGVRGIFYSEGDLGYRSERTVGHQGTKFDMTWQANNVHETKTGFEFKYYNIAYDYIYLCWDPSPFIDTYDVHPYEFSFYVQDKMEFEGMVVNAGVRFDYLAPNVEMRSDFVVPLWVPESLNYYRENNPEDTAKINELEEMYEAYWFTVTPKYQLNPRFGISYPVTEKTVLHLNYGHFFQYPPMDDMYSSIYIQVTRGNSVVGNPDLPAEKTVAYEFGIAHQVSDNMALDLTVFYKDIYDLVGMRLIQSEYSGAVSYYQFQGTAYGNAKGVEFTLNMRSDRISGHFAYTLSFAKGTTADPWEEYRMSYRGVDIEALARRIYPLSFDQRHTINMNIILKSLPEDPPLLRDAHMSLLTKVGSGHPYTPKDTKGNPTGPINSAWKPWTWTTDLKASKEIKLSEELGIALFLEVYNLFNIKNIVNVYEVTGEPDDDGKVFPEELFGEYHYGDYGYDIRRDLNRDGVQTQYESWYTYTEAYHDYVNSPGNYGAPRQVRFGIEFTW